MLNNITYFQIFGKPLIMYGGIVTLLCFLFTAYIAVMNKKGNNKIPIEWHFRMAKISIALALIHGLLGILAFF